MASSVFNLSHAKEKIFSQEDIPLPIKRSGWRLFLHELERNTSPKKALDKILSWMFTQNEKDVLSSFKPNPIQRRILYLMVYEGYTQGQAALELKRSRETIKQYCINLRKQLGADSFLQVAAIAIERGWIPPPKFNIPKKV